MNGSKAQRLQDGKHAKPKKQMNPTNKKLLIFIIVGAVLCVILGYIIVRMCTAEMNFYDVPDNRLFAHVTGYCRTSVMWRHF